MIDQRCGYRKRTFLTAYAEPPSGQGAVPCLVRDLSRTGARLMIAGASALPDTFDLHINGRDQTLRVETRWRTATEVGVRLLAKIPLTACLPVGSTASRAANGTK